MSHSLSFLTGFYPVCSGCACCCGKSHLSPIFSAPDAVDKPQTVRQLTIWMLLLVTFVLSLPAKGNAAPPKRFEIQTFSLDTTSNNMLTLNLGLTVDDEEGLYNLLKDGAVVELGIDIQVERKRDWWSNASVATLRYTSVIRHDPLTREFSLTMPYALPQSDQPTGHDLATKDSATVPTPALTFKDRNLTRLLTGYWQNFRLPLIPLSLIELEGHNQTYVISCSVALNHIETPPWLAKNSVFWSAEIIPSITFSLEFFYQ